MSLEVSIRGGESQDSLLRRFQRVVQMDGILSEAKACRYFLSKGEAARLVARASARRWQAGGVPQKRRAAQRVARIFRVDMNAGGAARVGQT